MVNPPRPVGHPSLEGIFGEWLSFEIFSVDRHSNQNNLFFAGEVI
jgi:hypothetical protein